MYELTDYQNDLYDFMVERYGNGWVSVVQIQPDWSDHKKRWVSEEEIEEALKVMVGFHVEDRREWHRESERYFADYRARCTDTWDFYMPDVMYDDPTAECEIAETDVLELLSRGDLLMRRPDGEIVPVKLLSFWILDSIVSIENGGRLFNEDGLNVRIKRSPVETTDGC